MPDGTVMKGDKHKKETYLSANKKAVKESCGCGEKPCVCDSKENKESTMTGKKETEIDTEPKISYNK